MLGPDSPEYDISKTETGLWLGREILEVQESTVYVRSYADANRLWKRNSKNKLLKAHPRPDNGIRFFGWTTADLALPAELKVLHVPSGNSLFKMCAQEIYMAFLLAVFSIVEDIGGDTEIFALRTAQYYIYAMPSRKAGSDPPRMRCSASYLLLGV